MICTKINKYFYIANRIIFIPTFVCMEILNNCKFCFKLDSFRLITLIFYQYNYLICFFIAFSADLTEADNQYNWEFVKSLSDVICLSTKVEEIPRKLFLLVNGFCVMMLLINIIISYKCCNYTTFFGLFFLFLFFFEMIVNSFNLLEQNLNNNISRQDEDRNSLELEQNQIQQYHDEENVLNIIPQNTRSLPLEPTNRAYVVSLKDNAKVLISMKIDSNEEAKDFGENSCAICLDDFDVDHVVYFSECKHYFHYNCLYLWSKTSNKCPLCRNDFI